jgi:hypothetical protein
MDQEGKAGILPKLIDFPLPFHCFPPVCAAFLLSLPFVSRCAVPTPYTAAVLADSDRARPRTCTDDACHCADDLRPPPGSRR